MSRASEPAADAVRVDHDVKVPMRDGIELATDIYRPAATDAGSRLPVILERTPYDKRGISRSELTAKNSVPVTRAELAAFFARYGFAVVMQDCRGRYASGGVFRKYLDEAEDGYDTLQWLLQQSWCNGKVGTMGLSYGAHTQCALACLEPPGLACMFMDSGGFASAWHGGIRRGGAFELKQVTWAHRHALRSLATRCDPARDKALRESDLHDWFRRMPWRAGHSPLSAAPEYEDYLFDMWRAARFDAFWQQAGLYAEGFYDRFPDVPTAIIGSWYDPYVLTCISNFQNLARRHGSPVRLVMGPWTHGDRSTSIAGDVDFGEAATLDGNIAGDYRVLRLAWFRRWLQDTGSSPLEPPVQYFRMGGGTGHRTPAGRLAHGGRWLQAECWPPPGTSLRRLYFHADGSLCDDAPASASILEYRFDPHDPVPTIGGAVTSGAPLMRGGAFDQRTGNADFTARDVLVDQPLAVRPDVLVFESPVLQEDLVICGAVVIRLFVSSDCPDTDFTAKLVDCYPPGDDNPDGYAMNITDGIFRMRYREGWDREVMLQPDAVYEARIEPFATCNLFAAGHRLRIDISSSNFPMFDVNPNTGAAAADAAAYRVATNRLHIGASPGQCSELLLPVAPASGD